MIAIFPCILSGRKSLVILWVFLLLLSSCGEEQAPIPKPRAFPRIYFPKKGGYRIAELPDCPFRFEIPAYARIEKDPDFFKEKAPNPCWFNVFYPDFNARIHFSYYDVRSEKDLFKYINDAFKMAGKHTSKANYIDERVLAKPNGVYGRIFEIEGPAASPLQFYLTDSISHYIRGSLYVKAKIKTDSLAPIYDFIKEDMAQLFNSFDWKKS